MIIIITYMQQQQWAINDFFITMLVAFSFSIVLLYSNSAPRGRKCAQ